jgi:signal transduction histidine kinase
LKKTFVRYISHEVRSPLSTTSLGLDCMFNLFTATNGNVSALNYSELVELVRDCRITCSAALHTLNDLLLFDKIENNMLKLEIKQTNIKSFLEECLQPFVRQVRK